MTPPRPPELERLPARPRGHHAATTRLLHWLAGTLDAAPGGGLAGLLPLLGPAAALPDEAGRSPLKYDVYLAPRARSATGVSPGPAAAPPWGLALNNRWEGDAFLDRVGAWVQGLGEGHSWGLARAWAGPGPHAAGGLSVGVGFDRPGVAPRLKLYVQEPRWGEAVGTAGALRRRLAALDGPPLPDWIPDPLPLGVVTIELHAGGAWAPRLYLGGEALAAVLPAAPRAAAAALDRLAALCPSAGHDYLTVRLRPGGAPRLTANRIYNPVPVALVAGSDPAAVDAELAALFDEVGATCPLPAARAALPDLRLSPTAVALDLDGPQVDLYVGAWALEAP